MNIYHRFLATLLLAVPSVAAVAEPGNPLTQVEAAEAVKIASQEMAEAYLYIGQEIRVAEAKADLEKSLASLDQSVKTLTSTTQDSDGRGVVNFMQFSLSELRTTLGAEYNKENAGLVLDYSDTLLEAADFIVGQHAGDPEAKKGALLVVDEMAFLLQRITKYYIAFRAGFKDANNVKQLDAAVAQFENDLDTLGSHPLPAEHREELTRLKKYWPEAKDFYLGVKENALPVIVNVSTEHMERSLAALREFHEQQQAKR